MLWLLLILFAFGLISGLLVWLVELAAGEATQAGDVRCSLPPSSGRRE